MAEGLAVHHAAAGHKSVTLLGYALDRRDSTAGDADGMSALL